jgi:hypothetical protein
MEPTSDGHRTDYILLITLIILLAAFRVRVITDPPMSHSQPTAAPERKPRKPNEQ